MVLRADAPSGARLARETSALAASQTRTTQAPPRQPALLERKGRVECYDFRRCAPLSTCDCLPRSGSHLRSPCAKRVASAPQPSPPCNCTPSQHAAAAHPLGVRARPRVGATRLDVPPRHFAQAVECAQLRVDLPVRRAASGRRAPMPHTDRCQSRVSSYESPCSLCVFPACA